MASKELSILITARDQASAAIHKVSGAVTTLGHATGGIGGALGHFQSRLGQLAGAAGVVGLGGALFSIGGLLESGVEQAKTFGDEVYKLAAVTGLSAEKASALAGALDHYGISAETALKLTGMAEKNVGKLAITSKSAADFQKKWGFSLVDSNGHVKDMNELLLTAADYFNNKTIPAGTKAAAMAQIFGRSWIQLVPALKAGRQGLADAAEEAAKLGLTLTGKNLADLAKLRESTRSWNDALGGLKLQIGLAVVPALTDLSRAATNFLANGGRQQIVGFFQQLIAYGRQAWDVVQKDVIPIFKGIYSAWQAVPPQLRDLIIKGIAADRTVKFLFGFSPLDLGKNLLGGLIGGLGKSLFSRGGTPATPLFVADVTGGLGGGGGVLGGGGGLLGKLLMGGAAVAGGAFVGWNVGQFLNENGIGTPFGTIGGSVGPAKTAEAGTIQAVLDHGSSQQIQQAISNIEANLKPSDFGAQIALALDVNGVRTTLEQQLAALKAALPAREQSEATHQLLGINAKTAGATMSTDRKMDAENAQLRRHGALAQAHLQTLRDTGAKTAGGLSRLEGVDRGILAKKTSFTANVSVPVTVRSYISAADWVRTGMSYVRAAVNYGGFI